MGFFGGEEEEDRANILKRRGVILDRVCADSNIGGDQTLGFSSREKGEEKRVEYSIARNLY